MQEKLRQSEACLAEAQRLSHTGSFGWRVSTGESFWSEETLRIFQYDPSTKPAVELILRRVHPDDADLLKQTIENASHDKKDFELEHRLLMPDGSMKHVHIVAHAEGDKSGEPRYAGAVMDVTKRKRAEEELATRQGQLEEAQALAHLGSWNWDIPTGSLTWSEELYRVFGVNPMEFCPTHELFLEHLHPDDRPVFKAAIEGALSTRSPYDCELRIVRSDRSLRILHSRGV